MSRLLKSNLHFVWLVIFFGLHGLNEFGTSLSFWDVCMFSLTLLSSGFLLYFLFVRLRGNKWKAGLSVTMLLTVFVFFGAAQDFLGIYTFTARLSTLPYLLTVTLLLLIVFFIWLKRRRKTLLVLTKYLNLLFLLFLLLETGVLLNTTVFSSTETGSQLKGFKICDTCKKPPVYLVILDEYAGKHTLEKYFKFDNSFFYRSLSQRGFHLVDSSVSNYTVTVLSMASMLNMDFIGDNEFLTKNSRYANRYSLKKIKENPVTDFFSKHGYEIRNYSIFDFKQAPALVENDLWGGNMRLLTDQTLYGRVRKSLPFYLAAKNISSYYANKVENHFINQVDRSLSETVIRATQDASSSSKPDFTYIHLNLPHVPYLMDSLGNRLSYEQRKKRTKEQKLGGAYVEYLVYCNKRILKWVDEIQLATRGEAVILLMSDHGTRPLAHKDQPRRRTDNLNAVYIPGGDYSKWYKGFSNVNQFTVLLNELFNQELERKPDIVP
jgi:hypothetical protein